MREVNDSGAFRRDVKLLRRRGKDMEKLYAVVDKLRLDAPLEHRHRPHLLSGGWAGYWELHVEPDWLLIYEISDTILYLVRTGTHADLF